jgi:hypothetical protein
MSFPFQVVDSNGKITRYRYGKDAIESASFKAQCAILGANIAVVLDGRTIATFTNTRHGVFADLSAKAEKIVAAPLF